MGRSQITVVCLVIQIISFFLCFPFEKKNVRINSITTTTTITNATAAAANATAATVTATSIEAMKFLICNDKQLRKHYLYLHLDKSSSEQFGRTILLRKLQVFIKNKGGLCCLYHFSFLFGKKYILSLSQINAKLHVVTIHRPTCPGFPPF